MTEERDFLSVESGFPAFRESAGPLLNYKPTGKHVVHLGVFPFGDGDWQDVWKVTDENGNEFEVAVREW